MKIVDGFILRKIAGEMVVCGEGLNQVNFNKLITLNSSAAYLWGKIVDRDFDLDTLAQLLISNYEIDEQTAKDDAKLFVDSLQELGVIE